MKRPSNPWLWTALTAAVVASLYFALWFLQTAWLGSFPGRDVAYYSRWSLIQFCVAVAFALAALLLAVALYRRARLSRWKQRDG